METREVIIDGATFTVNNFSRDGAKETLEQLLKRIILINAEKELKKNIFSTESDK